MRYIRALTRWVLRKLNLPIPIWALPTIGEMRRRLGDY